MQLAQALGADAPEPDEYVPVKQLSHGWTVSMLIVGLVTILSQETMSLDHTSETGGPYVTWHCCSSGLIPATVQTRGEGPFARMVTVWVSPWLLSGIHET